MTHAKVRSLRSLREEMKAVARGERPARTAREAAIQVAPVGQIARLVDEGERIDDRDCQQGAAREALSRHPRAGGDPERPGSSGFPPARE